MEELSCLFCKPGDKLVLRLDGMVWHKIDQDRQYFSRDVRAPLPLSGFVARLIQNDWEAVLDHGGVQSAHSLPARPTGKAETRRLNISAELVRFLDSHPELQEEIIKEAPDGTGFHTLHRWAAALIQSYVSRPDHERERLFCYPMYRTCKIALASGQGNEKPAFGQMRVAFWEGGSLKKARIKPYSLEGGQNLPYNYLTGLGKAADGSEGWQPIAVRLGRISGLSLAPGPGLTAPQRQVVQAALGSSNIAYLRDKPVTVRVRFTDAGLDMLQWIVSNRPDFQFEGAPNGNTAVMHTSEKQAYIYLNRFGADAVVLEPASLRRRLQSFYRRAAEAYAGQSGPAV